MLSAGEARTGEETTGCGAARTFSRDLDFKLRFTSLVELTPCISKDDIYTILQNIILRFTWDISWLIAVKLRPQST